jgi:hypothetical protein
LAADDLGHSSQSVLLQVTAVRSGSEGSLDALGAATDTTLLKRELSGALGALEGKSHTTTIGSSLDTDSLIRQSMG